MKVSICYFSTIFSGGYKSKQLNSLISGLKTQNIEYFSYSMEYDSRAFFKREKNHFKSFIPLIPVWLYQKLPFKLYPSYYNYLLGEVLYYIIFRNKIIFDESSVVIVKNRPSKLLKYIKSNSSKKIVLEVDQQHPLFTKDVVQNQFMKYSVDESSIYLNKFAINDYINSFKYADKIIVYTEEQKRILNKYGVKDNVFINELGLEKNINKYNFKGKKIKIEYICFANHSLLKGTHRLIEVWNKYNLDENLYIVGSQESDFRKFIKSQKVISSNIKFIEVFSRSDLDELNVNKNLVGILLSYSEGYPRVVSEYFENQMPVIVSKIINRDVENNQFGKVVDNENDEEILNAVKYLGDLDIYHNCQRNIFNFKFKTNTEFVNNFIKIISNFE